MNRLGIKTSLKETFEEQEFWRTIDTIVQRLEEEKKPYKFSMKKGGGVSPLNTHPRKHMAGGPTTHQEDQGQSMVGGKPPVPSNQQRQPVGGNKAIVPANQEKQAVGGDKALVPAGQPGAGQPGAEQQGATPKENETVAQGILKVASRHKNIKGQILKLIKLAYKSKSNEQQ